MNKTSAKVKNRYNAKAYDRIALMVPKGTKQIWRDRAEQLGLSLNAYVRECVIGAEKSRHFDR